MVPAVIQTRGGQMTLELMTEPRAAGASRRLSPDRVAQLVHAAANADQRAWNALVAEFSGLIWAVARAHRLAEPEAADVVQATWLRLLEHLERLHDPARVGAWLA